MSCVAPAERVRPQWVSGRIGANPDVHAVFLFGDVLVGRGRSDTELSRKLSLRLPVA